MNRTDALLKDDLEGLFYQRIYLLIRKNGWARQSIGAAFGLTGGVLSIILGALLWAAIPLLAPGGFASFLNLLEIVFFVIPLPLLALGAYCLDLLEKEPSVFPLRRVSHPLAFERSLRIRPRQPHNN